MRSSPFYEPIFHVSSCFGDLPLLAKTHTRTGGALWSLVEHHVTDSAALIIAITSSDLRFLQLYFQTTAQVQVQAEELVDY